MSCMEFCYCLQGDYAHALVQYEAALERDAHNVLIRDNLTKLHVAMRRERERLNAAARPCNHTRPSVGELSKRVESSSWTRGSLNHNSELNAHVVQLNNSRPSSHLWLSW